VFAVGVVGDPRDGAAEGHEDEVRERLGAHLVEEVDLEAERGAGGAHVEREALDAEPIGQQVGHRGRAVELAAGVGDHHPDLGRG
jgi:hypothetical protein